MVNINGSTVLHWHCQLSPGSGGHVKTVYYRCGRSKELSLINVVVWEMDFSRARGRSVSQLSSGIGFEYGYSRGWMWFDENVWEWISIGKTSLHKNTCIFTCTCDLKLGFDHHQLSCSPIYFLYSFSFEIVYMFHVSAIMYFPFSG